MSPVVAVIVLVVMVAVTSIYNKRDRRLNECIICIMLFPVTKTLDEQWNGNLEQRIASAGVRENAA
jgi:hypothetical protein